MRIEAYNQVQQMYRSQRVNKTQQTARASYTDQVQISSFGKDIQITKAAVKASPDVRTELTAPLKEKIQSGTYTVDTSSFAEKLMQKYEEMR